jgi:hypothetical protein
MWPDGKSCAKSRPMGLASDFEGKKGVLGLRLAESEGAKL